MMTGGYGLFGGWGIFGMFFQIAIMIGAIYLIVLLFQSLFSASESKGRSGTKTSLQILEERYARGEINDEEFKQKKKVLKD